MATIIYLPVLVLIVHVGRSMSLFEGFPLGALTDSNLVAMLHTRFVVAWFLLSMYSLVANAILAASSGSSGRAPKQLPCVNRSSFWEYSLERLAGLAFLPACL